MAYNDLKRLTKVMEMIEKASSKLNMSITEVEDKIIDYLSSRFDQKESKLDVRYLDELAKVAEKKKRENSGIKGAITKLQNHIQEFDTLNKRLKIIQSKIKSEYELKATLKNKLIRENEELRKKITKLDKQIKSNKNEIEKYKSELKSKVQINKEIDYDKNKLRVIVDQKNNPVDTKLINMVLTAATIIGILVVIFFIVKKLQ